MKNLLEYNQNFLEQVKLGQAILNDAEKYGVKIVTVPNPGQPYWQVIGVHHVTVADGYAGQHNIFCHVLDEQGQRVPTEAKIRVANVGGVEETVKLDKSSNEPATNIPMWKDDDKSVWVEYQGLPSEKVINLNTRHPDEGPGVTIGHHSFYVVFQKKTKGEATKPTLNFNLGGAIVETTGKPVTGLMVQLIGSLNMLGTVQGAAVIAPIAVTWTQELTGFNGNRWDCWNNFVSGKVSQLNWSDFKDLALLYNPSLKDTGFVFQTDKTYFLPENRPLSSQISWDKRTITGYQGSIEACWNRYILYKVNDMSWERFKAEVVINNPQLTGDNFEFKAAKSYKLPAHEGYSEYLIHQLSGANGSYKFSDLPSGKYRLVISHNDYKSLHQLIVLKENQTLNLTLVPVKPPTIATPIAPVDSKFVKVKGRDFMVSGKPFKFIGVNIRGLLHYGHDKDYFRFAPFEHRVAQLQAAHDMGAKVVRVFLAHKAASPGMIEARLHEVLELMKNRFPSMYLLPTFTNLYGDVPFYVRGDDKFYQPYNGYQILNPPFFQGGFHENYLPLVRHIVSQFRNESQIFAWEIGNELKLEQNPEAFVKFNITIAQTIRVLDSNHLITTGMISTRHAAMKYNENLRTQLYNSPYLDFITMHYPHEDNDDSDLAKKFNKPFIIEENGFAGDNRSPKVKADMERWFGQGGSGYMPWGFMATPDNNDGDRIIGMDRAYHADWSQLFALYQQQAAILV